LGWGEAPLELDHERARAVKAIYAWRTQDKLGAYTIAQQLNARPDLYPPPATGIWAETTVYAILRNPKYTGHMVFGRRRTTKVGKTIPVPPEEWLWSPQPTHPRSSPALSGTPPRLLAPSMPAAATASVPMDRPGNLGGSDPWEDAESCQHRGSTPMSCASVQ
jgi:hypothetical protein